MDRSAGDRADEDDEIEWFTPQTKNKYDNGLISSSLQCQTNTSTHLCIHSPSDKFNCEMDYSIGGTYNKGKEEFWFFISTSVCHGNNYLLKLFVVTRRDVRFSLHIPKVGHNLTNRLFQNENGNYTLITGPTMEYHFATSKRDEIVFVKSYCFTSSQLEEFENYPLLLPCGIEIHTSYKVHPEMVNRIKLKYTVQLNEALYRTRNEGDFIIESANNNKYPVHLFVAAAHSPILRETIKSNQKSCLTELNDEDVEMLVKFLYIGSVDNLSADKAPNILMLAEKMGLPGLLQLGKIALSSNINADNAVDIAILAKKYKLEDLKLKVFNYIKKNPKLLLGSTIENLNDIDLMRSMLRYVGNPECTCEQRTFLYEHNYCGHYKNV